LSPKRRTYIRDRWELGATGTARTDAATQDPQRRVPIDYEGDIPTFVLDPQGLTLVPGPGQLTRWLKWKDGRTDLDRPPAIHGLKPQERSRIGLLGGGDEPTAKSGEKALGPITYNPTTGEVIMENRGCQEMIQAYSDALLKVKINKKIDKPKGNG
jgi:hypothetical protein